MVLPLPAAVVMAAAAAATNSSSSKQQQRLQQQSHLQSNCTNNRIQLIDKLCPKDGK